jgi:UDP-3-O-acyl-N-acetylglucosamine deacetylase
VRHKVLDLIGDLALLGRPLQGRIRARKAGHAVHIEFARALHDALTAPVVEVEENESERFRLGDRRRRS